MIAIDLEFGALDAFRRAWEPASRKALERAFKGEAFRLRDVVKQRFERGISPPRAPLTRELAKTYRREVKALRWVGARIGYRVEQSPSGDVTAAIGPMAFHRVLTADGYRMHLDPKTLPLVSLASGGRHTVTKEEQLWAIYKLRRRWGEPVRRPDETMLDAGAKRGATWRRRRGLGKAWKTIPKGWIPKVNTALEWPKREWVAETVRDERLRSGENVQRLYEMALRGERWAKFWWTP